jgi:hypothetical protein
VVSLGGSWHAPWAKGGRAGPARAPQRQAVEAGLNRSVVGMPPPHCKIYLQSLADGVCEYIIFHDDAPLYMRSAGG